MIFASTDLAARIERADTDLLASAARSIAARRPDADVFARPLAGGIAVHTSQASPLNKIAGLGFAGTPDVDELDAIERVFAERGEPLQVEVANLADPEVGALLTRRGYVLQGFESILGRSLATVHSPPDGSRADGIDVARSPAEELDTWIDTVVTGFATPDTQGVPSHETFAREALEPIIRDFVGAEGIVRYAARRAGAFAGGASMRLHDGIAQLCGAATLPAHRRHGVQSALLARRLADAAAAGCDLAVITTQPGSKSMHNAQRQGFELLYARSVLVRPITPA